MRSPVQSAVVSQPLDEGVILGQKLAGPCGSTSTIEGAAIRERKPMISTATARPSSSTSTSRPKATFRLWPPGGC